MTRLFFALLLSGTALGAMGQPPASGNEDLQADSLALTLKSGSLRVSTGSPPQGNWSYEQSAVNVLAIELESRLPNEARNFYISGEAIHYANAFRETSGPQEGKLYTNGVLGKLKYFFLRGEAFQPYAGLGIGILALDDGPNGSVRGIAAGAGLLGIVGAQLRWESVGLRVEYMPLWASVSDRAFSTRAVLVGLSFFQGPSQKKVGTKDRNKGVEVPRF